MLSLGQHKTIKLFVITIVLLTAILFFFTPDIAEVVIGVSLFCFGLLIIKLFFFRLQSYYLLLIFLIPLSLDTGFMGGAKLNLPAEGLLILAIPLLILFNQSYRSTVIKLLKHPISILLFVDFIIELLASLMSTHIDVSLKRLAIRFIFISGFYVVVNLLNKGNIHKPWLYYVLGLVPVMYFTIRNHIHHSFNPRMVVSISQPYFNDHTIYGACLAFIIPILILFIRHRNIIVRHNYQTIILILVTLTIILSEILALSRASILSLIFAGLFAILLKFKVSFRTIIIGMVVILSTSLVMKESIYNAFEKNDAVSNDGEITNHFRSVTNLKSDASNLERINRWICAYRMFEERPLIGYGPGTYQFEYNQFQSLSTKTYISTNSGNQGNAHSEYLTYLSETGIFGFLVFILTVFSSIYYGMRNHYSLTKGSILNVVNLGALLGLITFFFHGLFNSFIDQSKMAFLYFTALGTIVYINQILTDEKA